jgi:hypothetical protein
MLADLLDEMLALAAAQAADDLVASWAADLLAGERAVPEPTASAAVAEAPAAPDVA